ncbi:MAG: radical SAM protein [Gammaproteobacteria bacterium]|nr:MAG: radical SAM protein [Gammaproteobacteria bacterium]
MYSPFRHTGSIFWKNRPIHLTFFVTRRCNARCPFCFYVSDTNNQGGDSIELSLEEIQRISQSLGKLLWLAFSGGEIFLRKDLVEISKLFYAENKPAIMLFPTNGLLPELIEDRIEEILRNCHRSVVVVKLSIDGLDSDHDTLRNTPGGFDKTMQTYRLLGKLLDRYPNFELGINTLFCSQNQDKMDAIIDYVRGLKHIKTHTISAVRGNLLYSHYKVFDPRKYQRAIHRLQENIRTRTADIYRFRGAHLKAAQDILQRRLIHQTMLSHERQIPCYAGRLNLVLTESGDVYPCEILSTSFGNIREYGYDLKKIIHSERARSILESIHQNHCYCTHECNFITNILFNPRLYPILAKEYVQIQGPHSTRVNAPGLRL